MIGCPIRYPLVTAYLFFILVSFWYGQSRRGSQHSCQKAQNSPGTLRSQGFPHAVSLAFHGGDKRDRTADLLNAIQALSRTIGYAPPDGLGKGLNIPPRQLMRDKLQYSIEGICCQLDIPLRYVPLAVVVARVRAYCAMGSS